VHRRNLIHYLIYKTTNILTGEYYIGKHATNDIYDSYLGSGIILKHKIKKYGKECFSKEILHIFDNVTEMNNKEIEIITEDVVLDPMSYNLALGGMGGCIALFENNPNYHQIIEKIKLSKVYLKEFYSELAKSRHETKSFGMHGRQHSEDSIKKMVISGKALNITGENNPMYGRKHTEESKKMISDKKKGRKHTEEHKKRIKENHADVAGVKNPMYGKKHSDKTKKMISDKAKEKIKIKGSHSPNNGKFWITNGTDSKFTLSNIPEGWYKGRTINK